MWLARKRENALLIFYTYVSLDRLTSLCNYAHRSKDKKENEFVLYDVAN